MALNRSLPDGDDHDFFDPEYAYDFYDRAFANDSYEENQPGLATQDKWPGTMDWHLLKACSMGDLGLFKHLTRPNHADAMLSTPLLNNCLHIAAMFGHRKLAKEILSTAPSLSCGTNIDGETPLIAALMSANKFLASDMIDMIAAAVAENSEGGMDLQEMLLKADRRGETALHHAIRNGFDELAVQLLNIEPLLSNQVNRSEQSGTLPPSSEQSGTLPPKHKLPEPVWNKSQQRLIVDMAAPANESVKYKPHNESAKYMAACRESAMYMAARRGYPKVVEKLLEIESSAVSGGRNESALHAAVRSGNKGIVEQLLKGRPQLAYSADNEGDTSLVRAIFHNKIELVEIFLKHDPYLAYVRNTKTERTPFIVAAIVGSVKIAKKIMKACPDSVYTPDKKGKSALHAAIENEQPHFVDFVLQNPQLNRLINQTSNNGNLPLHLAATRCNPEILHSLLPLVGQDCTAVDVFAYNAVNKVYGKRSSSTNIGWIESFVLLRSKIPSGWTYLSLVNAKRMKKKGEIKNLRPISKQYTSSTSLVASLIATVTFTAAFTLPGGLSNDPSDNGLPVLAKRAAFQVFLISDTIAMCSSLAAAFMCILSNWKDMEILLNYMRMTKFLMWCAFGTTSLAFGTGLFVVMAPKHLWLSVLILIPCIILPFTTMIMGQWPLLKLRYRLGGEFPEDLKPLI